MQLDNNYKKRFINHISYAAMVCILLSSLPLEGCFENTSLPFSKSSAIKPATVKPKHIDKISPLTREAEEKIKEDILLENHREEPLPEATDRLSIHTDDIPETTIVDNVQDHSEKPKLLSKRDIKTQQKFAREERENQLKDQKKLEAKTFKTRQGGYTIKFYQKEGNWTAKVTHENIKPMDLVAILDEEAISRLVNVNPIKNHLRVILPTVDKEGFVVYDTGFGGMKRKQTLLQSSSISDNSASSALSQSSDTTITTSVTTTPKANTSTSDTSSSLTTGNQTPPKSPGSSPVKKKAKKSLSLSLRKTPKPKEDNNPNLVTPVSTTSAKSNTSEILNEIKTERDLYYGDDDIAEFINIFLKNNSDYGYYQNSNYLLSSRTDEFSPILDQEDGINYIVAVSPAIDRTGLSHTQNLRTGGTASATNIDYWLDKSTHPKNTPEEVLEKVLSFDLSSEKNPYDALLAKIEEVQPNSDRVKFIDDIVEEKGEDLTSIIDRFRRKLDEINRSKRKDIFDELMPFFLKENTSDAKILIPYNLTESHWLTGEIQIHKEGNIYQVEVFAHDPMGGGEMEDKTFNKLQNAIEKRIKEHDSQAKVTCKNKQSPYSHKRQIAGDNTSCGVISTEEIIARITGPIKSISYPIGALDLRKTHIDLINRIDPSASFLNRNKPKLQYIIEGKTDSPKNQDKRKEKDQKKPDDKLESQEDSEAQYQYALKFREEKDVRKAYEYAIRAENKGHGEAKKLVVELEKEGENIFQEAEKLLAESIKEKKEEIFQQKIKEAVTKYENAAYLGYKPAQEKLIKLRDGKNGMQYNKVIPYVIKKSEVAEKSLTTLRTSYQSILNNQLPSRDHVLKLSDLIIMELDLQKAPQRVEWGGRLPENVLQKAPHKPYKPLFEMPATDKYEDMVMVIDLAGKGGDETAYCVVKRYKDYYFIMAVGGIGGDYIKDKEKRLPALPEMLDKITKIIKEYNVKFIRVENNIDASYEVVLRRHLAENFIQAEVQGYHQGSELIDNTESNIQNEEAEALGKATRIKSSLETLLEEHQIIISQNAFLDDLNSVPRNNFNYKFFFQLESVKIPPDTKKYRHDDRVDATASAISYLYKKREEEKKKKTRYKRNKDFLKLAEIYNQEKKLKTGEKQIKKARKAYNNYAEKYKSEYSSDFADDSPNDDKERTNTMLLCECEMGWLQIKYLGQEKEGIENLTKAAADKYPKAQYRLAKIYLKKRKEKEGIDFLEKAASRDAKAQYRLAKIYLKKGKEKEGIDFLEKAATRNIKAKYRFASMFFENHQEVAKRKKAIEYFKELADNTEELEKLAYKHPEINYKLGCIYFQIDISGKREPRKALNFFLRYLKSERDITSPNYKQTAYRIAKIYHYSQGLESSDLNLALEYYTKAIGLSGKEEKIQKRIKKINQYKIQKAA